MQSSPRGSSSDLERARALALRLSQDPASPDRAPAPPPGVYVRFSASRFRSGEEPPPPPPSAPSAVPHPEPPPPPVARATAPAARPAPPPRGAAPAKVEAVEEPPEVFVDTSAAEDDVQAETELQMEEVAETEAPTEAAPAPKPAEPEPAILTELTPEPSEFEENLEPLPWSQILEDCVYLAHGRGAFAMNAKGQIAEVMGPWPKPKLEPIGARLMKLMDEATTTQAEGAPSPTPTLQLGTFCLTGLRVAIAGQDVTVGLIAEAALSPEARPAIEAELRRGKPM